MLHARSVCIFPEFQINFMISAHQYQNGIYGFAVEIVYILNCFQISAVHSAEPIVKLYSYINIQNAPLNDEIYVYLSRIYSYHRIYHSKWAIKCCKVCLNIAITMKMCEHLCEQWTVSMENGMEWNDADITICA